MNFTNLLCSPLKALIMLCIGVQCMNWKKRQNKSRKGSLLSPNIPPLIDLSDIHTPTHLSPIAILPSPCPVTETGFGDSGNDDFDVSFDQEEFTAIYERKVDFSRSGNSSSSSSSSSKKLYSKTWSHSSGYNSY